MHVLQIRRKASMIACMTQSTKETSEWQCRGLVFVARAVFVAVAFGVSSIDIPRDLCGESFQGQ